LHHLSIFRNSLGPGRLNKLGSSIT